MRHRSDIDTSPRANGSPPRANGSVPTPRHPKNRSAITNGKLFAKDKRLDPQTNQWVRRCRDLIDIYIAHCGGWDAVSAPERAIIRRVATHDVELELLEKQMALSRTGASNNQLDLYYRGSANQRRLLESLGLKRALKDVTPDLQTYLAHRETEVQEREHDDVDADEAPS
jgi:hypothetical protein